MQKILEDLEKLRQYSGNTQITWLSMLKSDLLREVLECTYNPQKKYKIDEGKFDKFVASHLNQEKKTLTQLDWEDYVKLLDMLSSIKSASDAVVDETVKFIYSFEEHDFLKMVLFKDLRLNMNIKKFQKAWPDFCVEPQVQLAQKFEGKKFYKNRYSRKLDGLRCYYLDNKAISRTNKPHKSAPLEHITKQIEQAIDKGWVLDGEIIYLNPDGTEDFTKAISLARSDDRTFECDNLYYVIFDMVEKDKFLSKQPSVPFDEEYERIKTRFGVQEEKVSWYTTAFPNLLLIKQVDDNRFEELQDARFKNNWEGLMLRDGDSPYEYKRTNKLLKIKEMQDTEVKLIDMEEGTGKYEGTLGALIADYNGFPLKIGSGLSDEQRQKYWNNKDSYIGKYVKVKYFEKTTNQQGGESLRFPIFLCFRDIDTMEEYI